MTLFYYDISSYQAGMNVKGLVVCVKATEGTSYKNPYYSAQRSGAEFSWAYHFLHHGNAVAQAQYCHSVVGSTPVMIDCEPTTGSNPTVADCIEFATELRRLGGVCTLVYYPKWYAGSQSLTALRSAGLGLVSSSYTSYSDSGPGWASYGGVAPVVWQYTDAARAGGKTGVDCNAFKGTLAQLKDLVNGAKAPTPEDELAPQWISGTVPTGDSATVVMVPNGSAWSGYKNMTLHLGIDQVGTPATSTVRVAYNQGKATWGVKPTVTVNAASGKVDVPLDMTCQKLSLQVLSGGPVAYGIEVF